MLGCEIPGWMGFLLWDTFGGWKEGDGDGAEGKGLLAMVVVRGFIRGPILATSGGCGTARKLLDLSALANHIAKDAFIAVRPRSLTVSRANLFEKPKDLNMIRHYWHNNHERLLLHKTGNASTH